MSSEVVIEPGKTYVLEYPGRLTDEAVRNIQDSWDKTGAKAVILEEGMKVARLDVARFAESQVLTYGCAARFRTMACTAELLEEFLKANPFGTAHFTVEQGELPADTRIVDASFDPARRCILFTLESQSFEEAFAPYPEIRPLYRQTQPERESRGWFGRLFRRPV